MSLSSFWSKWSYGGCTCPPNCMEVETHHEAVQYVNNLSCKLSSHIKFRVSISKRMTGVHIQRIIMTWSWFLWCFISGIFKRWLSLLWSSSRTSAVDEEVEEYSHTQLWSDIGGATGLMLGMSFATFIGILDWLVSLLVSRRSSFV